MPNYRRFTGGNWMRSAIEHGKLRPIKTTEDAIASGEAFRCVLCERVKDNTHRRQPASIVCVECVDAAGFQGE